MGETELTSAVRFVEPFNGPVEIGLRALTLLVEGYPEPFSLQRLVVFDYLLVHSDDLDGGPRGLHPRTPHRGGEIFVRRGTLQYGIRLYESRGLIQRLFATEGVGFVATEDSASFIDSLSAQYVTGLRERARWLVDTYGRLTDDELMRIVRDNVGAWGSEFEMESVLWTQENQ